MKRSRLCATALFGLLSCQTIQSFLMPTRTTRTGESSSTTRQQEGVPTTTITRQSPLEPWNFQEKYQERITSTTRRRRIILSSSTSSLSAAPPVITIQDVSCTHNGGETWQLRDVSYVLARGAKVALVGRNGCGKSTLLRILAEQTLLDKTVSTADMGFTYTGSVTSPRQVRVAYVDQEPNMPETLTVSDALLGISGDTATDTDDANKSVYAAVRRYQLAAAQADTDPEAFGQASAEMESLGGWDVLTKAQEVATQLRVRHLMDQSLATLSGGERKRVAVARALVQSPDVLLLDEPTNYLSLAGVQWLADVLVRDKKLTLLMVTHDRAFLHDVCNQILELDQGKLYEYQGNNNADGGGDGNDGPVTMYESYLLGKEARLANQEAAVQSAKSKYKTELEWMRRQPQARQTKAKARIEAFGKLQQATRPVARDPSLTIDVAGGARRLGGNILSMKSVSLTFGDRLMLDDFSYNFCKGDRILLAGANGVGKTTFLRVLTGMETPDSGTIDVGETVVFGMYDQLGLVLDATRPDQTVLQFVMERVQSREGATLAEAPDEARRLLRRFEFPAPRWNERVTILSGGERRRLQLLSVLSQRPNVLVMDEPSVDCDLDTLTALEAYLAEFEGVLLVVSHDRSFADKVTDHIFIFEGEGQVKDFGGSLSEYARTLVEMENESIGAATSTGGAGEERKAAYKEDRAKRNEQRNTLRRAKKDMDNLEGSIEKLKAKAAETEKEIAAKGDEGWSILAELSAELEAINGDIDEKEMKWMELAELLEEAEVEA